MKTKLFLLVSIISLTFVSCTNDVLEQDIRIKPNISAIYDSTQTDKQILAGTTGTIAEFKILAKYQDIECNKITIKFSRDVYNSILDVQLVYDNNFLATNPIWSENETLATFDDLEWIITSDQSKKLRILIYTNTINEDGGLSMKDVCIKKIAFSKCVTTTDGILIDDMILNTKTESFNIVPATLSVSVSSIGSKGGIFGVTCFHGLNLTKTEIKHVKLEVKNNTCLTELRIKDGDNGIVLGTSQVNGNGEVIIDINTAIENSESKSFVLTSSIKNANTLTYDVLIKSILYTSEDGEKFETIPTEKLILQK